MQTGAVIHKTGSTTHIAKPTDRIVEPRPQTTYVENLVKFGIKLLLEMRANRQNRRTDTFVANTSHPAGDKVISLYLATSVIAI